MFSAGSMRCRLRKCATAKLQQGKVFASGKLLAKRQQAFDAGTLVNVFPQRAAQGLYFGVRESRDVTRRGTGTFGSERLQGVGKTPDSITCGTKDVGQRTAPPAIQMLDEAAQMMKTYPTGFIKGNHDSGSAVAIIGDP